MFISIIFAKNIARFAFGVSSFIFIAALEKFQLNWTSLPFILFGLLIVYVLISDLIPRLLALQTAQKHFLAGSLLTSIYMSLLFPLLNPFCEFLDIFIISKA